MKILALVGSRLAVFLGTAATVFLATARMRSTANLRRLRLGLGAPSNNNFFQPAHPLSLRFNKQRPLLHQE